METLYPRNGVSESAILNEAFDAQYLVRYGKVVSSCFSLPFFLSFLLSSSFFSFLSYPYRTSPYTR